MGEAGMEVGRKGKSRFVAVKGIPVPYLQSG